MSNIVQTMTAIIYIKEERILKSTNLYKNLENVSKKFIIGKISLYTTENYILDK